MINAPNVSKWLRSRPTCGVLTYTTQSVLKFNNNTLGQTVRESCHWCPLFHVVIGFKSCHYLEDKELCVLVFTKMHILQLSRGTYSKLIYSLGNLVGADKTKLQNFSVERDLRDF